MLLSRSLSSSFKVAYFPNVTQIKDSFKFNKLTIDFFFRFGLPPYESNYVSKMKFKLPAKTIWLLNKSLIVSNILPRSRRVVTCSVSILWL